LLCAWIIIAVLADLLFIRIADVAWMKHQFLFHLPSFLGLLQVEPFPQKKTVRTSGIRTDFLVSSEQGV